MTLSGENTHTIFSLLTVYKTVNDYVSVTLQPCIAHYNLYSQAYYYAFLPCAPYLCRATIKRRLAFQLKQF
jgi:hypothetical protein